jgi:hypothetical protein
LAFALCETVARKLSSKALSEIDTMPKQLRPLDAAGFAQDQDKFLLKANAPILRD